MSELRSKEDIANEYFKVQQILNYQKAFEELKNRNKNLSAPNDNTDTQDNKKNKNNNKINKDSYCCILL